MHTIQSRNLQNPIIRVSPLAPSNQNPAKLKNPKPTNTFFFPTHNVHSKTQSNPMSHCSSPRAHHPIQSNPIDKPQTKSQGKPTGCAPLLSLSPSLLTHETILPSVMVELNAGMKISRIFACTTSREPCLRLLLAPRGAAMSAAVLPKKVDDVEEE